MNRLWLTNNFLLRRKVKTFVSRVKKDVHNRSLPCEGNANPTHKRKELKHPFYSLTEEAKSSFTTSYDINVPMNEPNVTPPQTPSHNATATAASMLTPEPNNPSQPPDTPGLIADMMEQLELDDL